MPARNSSPEQPDLKSHLELLRSRTLASVSSTVNWEQFEAPEARTPRDSKVEVSV